MPLLSPNDFPSIKGRAQARVLRILNNKRLVLSPQAAHEMGLENNGRRKARVLFAQDNSTLKIAPADAKRVEDGFPFKPAPTNKQDQYPPFAMTNPELAQHITSMYGLKDTKRIVFELTTDGEWWTLTLKS